MKILFILHYPPPIHGSSAIGGFIKNSRLINENFDCRYINLGISSTVEEIGKNSIGKLWRYIRLIWQVKKELLFFRPDLCYLTINSKGAGFYKDFLIVLLVRLFRVKSVYHFHNKGVRIRQNKFIDNILYKITFRNSSVILISKKLYQDIEKYVPENRIYYCPNGIPGEEDKRQKSKDKSQKSKQSEDPDRTAGPDRRVRSVRDKSKNSYVEILFISHLIESKGVFVLLKACKILHDKSIDFHCTMIGGEGDVSVKMLKSKIAEAGLNEIILIAGKKIEDEKAEAFNRADIFVHPSFDDCMPLVLLEAMQHSLPIVSTYEGAIPDVVEEGITGFLVAQKSAAALAEKLGILINDPELCLMMGKAGREKYEKEFTLEIFERRMVEIITEVTEKRI